MSRLNTYVITGAGTGMGRATAELLSKNPNISLLLIGRREALLEETLAACEHRNNHRIAAIDIRDADAWKNTLASNFTSDTNLCGVFANAGVGGENHYGQGDRWEDIISTNLTGTYVTIMELLPWLRQSSNAFKHIVITSSCLARFGVPNYTAYCTAKTGLLGLTRSLAIQLASDHILVNALCPGWVETDMARAGIQNLADRAGQNYDSAFAEQMGYVPLNRISQPLEIAQMVRFLFSNEQTSMTGQGIDINNGSYMQ
ncbi:MAG: SDR family NAD(P)-dependent oxidoreductase [Flavobacteriales bacterium]|jgi:NAD(P)-dependent dehydrogenase (short-subunit alcohol dehydrogenase family)